MKSPQATIKRLQGRAEKDYDADEFYDELMQDWHPKAQRLLSRRWRKLNRKLAEY